MTKRIFNFTIPVKPRTKKNHSQLVTLKNGRQMLLPSKPYKEFEKAVCEWFKKGAKYFMVSFPIQTPVNLKCHFYKDKNYKSDLAGYLQAIQDSLVKAGFLDDDNSKIVVSTDGSRVLLDRENPRIEVEVTFLEGENYV
ncbi:MAG: RusA family crossover junction endodeoxyribonuclease [Candidatus Gastranaerophilales bacterium]|nr:RusA family crossover junction endodeoxyribonuclease [Candidatus Gastranaerophilales bacterium]